MVVVAAHALAEKVYRELTNNSVDDYDIIPGSVHGCFSSNDEFRKTCLSEDAVFVVERHLGLNANSVPTLYKYCYERLFEARRLHFAGGEGLSEYNGSVLDGEQGDCISCVLLLLNPEVAAGWNYRRWLLRCHPSVSPSVFATEAAVCEAAARRYRSNYHAWSHRQWSLTNLVSGAKARVLSNEEEDKVLAHELLATAKFCDEFVSDYSGFHYRQFVIARIRDSSARSHYLVDELVRTKKSMLEIGLCFEALWYHRRALVYVLACWREGDSTNDERFARTAARLCADEIEFASALEAPLLRERGNSDVAPSPTRLPHSPVDWSATLLRRYLHWLRWLAGYVQQSSPDLPT